MTLALSLSNCIVFVICYLYTAVSIMLVGSFRYWSLLLFIGLRIRCLFHLSSSVSSLGHRRRSTLAVTFSTRVVHHLVRDYPPCLYLSCLHLSCPAVVLVCHGIITNSIKAYIVIASAGGHPVSSSSPQSIISVLVIAHPSTDSSSRPRLCRRLPIRQELQPR